MELAAHPCSLKADLCSQLGGEITRLKCNKLRYKAVETQAFRATGQEGRVPCSLKLVQISQAWTSLISTLSKKRQVDLLNMRPWWAA